MSKDADTSTLQTTDIILVACVIAILFVSAFWTCKMCCKPDVQPVRIEVVTSDSLCQKNYLSKEQADSLITVVKRHEQELAERYQYALEQKMSQDQYYSLGTFVVGVILSLFGFFGYKSIKSIEEKANKDADRAAKQTSEDVTKGYLNEKLQGMVAIAAEEIFKSHGAETMKAKVQEETIRHDDEYIDSQLKNIKKELKEFVQSLYQQNGDGPIEEVSDDSDQTNSPDEESDDEMFK